MLENTPLNRTWENMSPRRVRKGVTLWTECESMLVLKEWNVVGEYKTGRKTITACTGD